MCFQGFKGTVSSLKHASASHQAPAIKGVDKRGGKVVNDHHDDEDNDDDDGRADGASIPLEVYGCWDASSLTRLQTDGVFITASKEITRSGGWAGLRCLWALWSFKEAVDRGS